MGTQAIGVLLPESTDASDAAFASRAESLGYDSIWVGENWGANAFLRLGEVARETDEIGIGTAITNVYSRSPATIAMSGVTLDRLSDGRFHLGVGPSSPKIVEDLHGMAFDRPVRRTHEAVELIRAFTRNEGAVEYNGELFEVADFPSLERPYPIYNAALGSANLRATGRLFDGWLPTLLPFSELADSFETITDAATEAGRDPSEITIAPYLPVAVSDDLDRAREPLQQHVAFYAGNSPSFKRAIATAFPDRVETVASRWREGDRGGAVEAVTDEMLEELSVFGTPETARERLRDVLDAGVVDVPLLALPAGVDDELIEDTVQALAPESL